MRLKLKLRISKRDVIIPINYAYYLSSAVYHWIERSSPVYSKFLHERGYEIEGTVKRFKHFCFSRLIIKDRRIYDSRIKIMSPTIEWYISMPVEEALQHLMVGIFEKQELYIEKEENKFAVEQVESLPEPTWESSMKFKMISPLTISVPEDRNDKIIPHYLRPNDERLNDSLKTNILNKFKSLYGDYQEDTHFSCRLDEKYIKKIGGINRISKLITIKEGREEETKIRAFVCPIQIDGNIELIKLAYESGLGEKGSLGFGMLEVIKSDKRI